MIKEKYKQLCLHRLFGGIYTIVLARPIWWNKHTIEFTQSLPVIKKDE